jgi:hypothetical protein
MAKFAQTYPADLKYTEWQQTEQYFPLCKGPGLNSVLPDHSEQADKTPARDKIFSRRMGRAG